MLKSHDKFHSSNGKRTVLVVDDELINRELMGIILEQQYEVIYAEDGQRALDLVSEHHETLSLILLDLMMPVMMGRDVLRIIKADPLTRHIPVIVLTADQNAEIECLNMGAVDFIPKPYPDGGVILARIARTIELSEDRQIIQVTERDPLTDLYNREYFYRYAEQFDHHHRGLEMDAIVVDVNHFHMINERFGTAYGDEVLRQVGQKLREAVSDTGGIVCRREADTFMIYCPHGKTYKTILDNATVGLEGDDSVNNRVRLRMGVYANVDKSMDIERRFDRAKMAADTVRNSFTRAIGMYDKTLHEHELYAEQLIEDFPTAIADHQFVVYYQPKFDVRPEIPVLASAEALIRWVHPTLGMISPGVFIPLFEENGLIQTLDNYVWRTTAAQIRDWKDRFGFSVPVSVNVSRIDMYDPDLVGTFQRILDDFDLTPGDLHLEITESAYTQDSAQIIDTVNELRSLGFCIEMDDFGTGYSSLNMISTLPIDALKLDMQFIRTAFNDRHDTRIIEVIIDIAKYLAVPVIAEGVETKEQLLALRAMGCDIVQGYYFSRPIPADEYERFVVERRDQQQAETPEVSDTTPAATAAAEAVNEEAYDKIAYALSNGYERVYYVDIESHHYVQFSAEGRFSDLQIQSSGNDFFEEVQQTIQETVFAADQQRMALCLQKDALLAQLMADQSFSLTYRINVEGIPTYFALRVVRADTHDSHHIVIGVSNLSRRTQQADPLSAPSNELDFTSLAKALSCDMESIYYVDTVSDTYMEFTSGGSYSSLKLEISGTNFFEECRNNIRTVVYAEDRDRVSAAMDKEELLLTLSKRKTLTIDYRLLVDDKPLFYRMKIIPTEAPNIHHLIIGVTNIDDQVNSAHHSNTSLQSAATYSRIAQALAEDYFSIYYVDTYTDDFIEYSSFNDYSKLGIETSGGDFFNLSRKNMERVCHPDDLPQFLEAFTRENILRGLEEWGTFTLTYRLMFDGVPIYAHMKATRMADKNDPHIVVGVSNIDAQMKREQEYAKALRTAKEAAYRDSLTGVKSKHAYLEAEESLNDRIAAGTAGTFAIAICDINDLKVVNDTQGHAAGDELIRVACREVCRTFAHSPVYRYGGDEFVAVLRGHDFEHRVLLADAMHAKNQRSIAEGDVVIACGLADFVPGRDLAMSSVFKRADAAMYENKKELKRMSQQG